MNKIITLLCGFIMSLAAPECAAQQTPTKMTDQERAFTLQTLKESASSVSDAIKGLSEAQMNFKVSVDRWSIAECIKHIAAAEKELWKMAEPTLNQPANPEKRSAIKFTDEQLIAAVKDRSHKSKTFAALEPANSPYKTVPEALAAFKENRKKLMAFVRTTSSDLRNHVVELPIGTYDIYQFILLIAAHTDRHVQQLNEVKSELQHADQSPAADTENKED